MPAFNQGYVQDPATGKWVPQQNFLNDAAQAADIAQMAAGGGNGTLGGFFNKAKGFGNKATTSVKNFFTGKNPNFGWSAGKGVKAFGKNIGTGANVLGGIMYGADTLQGISNYNNTIKDNEDLMSKIKTSAMGNPLLSSYLTSEQLDLLGDIEDGRYDTNADTGDFIQGMVGGFGKSIPASALGLLTGGVPGAIMGGSATLINSGIDNLSDASGQNTAELQALYQALQDADAQYRSMKRPNFTGLGIQQRYQDMYA